MINLLPPQIQKQVYREYQTRIAVIALFLLGILGLLSGIIMVPSYFNLRIETLRLSADLETKKGKISTTDQSYEKGARALMSQVKILKGADGAHTAPGGLITSIIEAKPPAVVLGGFNYDSGSDKGPSLSIQGTADTRDDLLAFRDALESKSQFSSVELPAQTIIKKTNIPFVIRLGLGTTKPIPTPTPAAQNTVSTEIEP